MITKPRQEQIKIYALTSPVIASIAGKIMAGATDVPWRDVKILAASALAQARIPAVKVKTINGAKLLSGVTAKQVAVKMR